VLALAGCRSELPVDAVQDELRAYFEGLGIEPDALRCPAAPAAEVGAETICRAWIDGEPVEMRVEVVSADGELRLHPRDGTLVTAEVETEIAATLRAEGRAVERVRCEGRLWVTRPGAVRRCVVEVQGGERLAWIGTFSGEGSRHRARVVPLHEGMEAGG